MIQKQRNWMPYELKLKNVEKPKMTCELLLQRHKRKSFLRHIVTSDEKWIRYNNPKRKKSCRLGESSIDGKAEYSWRQVHALFWWDQLGIVYYTLLQPNEIITGERYQQQLMQLSRTLKQKWPDYAKRQSDFQAWPHVAKSIKKTLKALNCPITLAIFFRYCSFQLPPISIDDS